MYDREKTLMKAEDEWIDLKVDGDRLRKITDEKVKKELKSNKTFMHKYIPLMYCKI